MNIMMKHLNWFKEVLYPFELLRVNLKSLVKFELLFRLLLFLVLFPLLTWSQKLILIGSRTSVIAWYNIGDFILNPMTWLVFIFITLALTAAAMFEHVAIYDTLHASKSGINKTAGQIFSAGFDRCAELMKPENWGLIPYVFLVLHFGSYLDFSSVTSVIRIPGFILEDFEKHLWEKYLYWGILFIAGGFYLRLIFSIPAMMEEEDTSFSKACKKSWGMTKGSYVLRVFFLAASWIALIGLFQLAGTRAVVAGWYLLSMWVMPASTESFREFVAGRMEITSIISYLAFVWLSAPLMAASFQTAYYKRKQELGMEVRGYSEPPRYLKKYPVIKALVLAVCGVCIFFSVPGRYAQLKWMLNTNYGTPMIMAHRGYSAKAPENTLPAFRKCMDEGVTAAELDVQMLKDGTIIVMHDSNLKRTTGVDKDVWDVTYDEIRDLDNGSYFGAEYAGTRIPTLDEVIRLAGSGKNRLFLNIEIKRTGHDDGITQKVIDIILANNYLDHCDITSQDYSTLEEVRSINPNVLTAYTSVIGIGDIETLDAADIISIQESFASYENIDRIHSAGKHIFVWTVNEAETMENLISLNVDAILTNSPDVCREVIEQHSSGVKDVLYRIQTAITSMQ